MRFKRSRHGRGVVVAVERRTVKKRSPNVRSRPGGCGGCGGRKIKK